MAFELFAGSLHGSETLPVTTIHRRAVHGTLRLETVCPACRRRIDLGALEVVTGGNVLR